MLAGKPSLVLLLVAFAGIIEAAPAPQGLQVGDPIGDHPVLNTTAEVSAFCRGLPERHGTKDAEQPLAAPYDLTVSADSVKSGQTVWVTLGARADDTPFRGFLVRALEPGSTQAIGRFVEHDDPQVQIINCEQADSQNTVFQKQMRVDKRLVRFEWRAPEGFKGDVEFDATIVKTMAAYWTGVKTAKVAVV